MKKSRKAPAVEMPARRGPRKDGVVTFRVDDDQWAALEHAARAEGDTLGNWCRRHLLQVAGWKYSAEAH